MIMILTKMMVIFADLDSFEDEEELDSSDDYLDLEFDEKPAPEPEKETSKNQRQLLILTKFLKSKNRQKMKSLNAWVNSIPDSLYRVVTI